MTAGSVSCVTLVSWSVPWVSLVARGISWISLVSFVSLPVHFIIIVRVNGTWTIQKLLAHRWQGERRRAKRWWSVLRWNDESSCLPFSLIHIGRSESWMGTRVQELGYKDDQVSASRLSRGRWWSFVPLPSFHGGTLYCIGKKEWTHQKQTNYGASGHSRKNGRLESCLRIATKNLDEHLHSLLADVRLLLCYSKAISRNIEWGSWQLIML